MKYVVTGATGMIGIHLIKKIIEENHFVYAIVHKGSKRIGRIPKNENVRIIECDLNELETLPSLIDEKIDCFYHLAWDGTFGSDRNLLYSQINNIKYSLDAVNIAYHLGCKVFIGAGSQAEFGRTKEKLSSKVACFPENGYGMAKLCSGEMTRIECEKYGIKHIWLRILSIYGPYDGDNTLISYATRKCLKNEDIDTTYGEQVWDYMYVKDCANAMYLISKNGIGNKIYCIGSGKTKKIKEYLQIIKEKTKSNSKINFGAIKYSEKQVMNLVADISELEKDTGFKTLYSFEQGIEETILYWKGLVGNE